MGLRLKRLECYGFKSFADRLSFDFETGITAVIGPNGCGKSNVVDSIKWVVGEQSAKALRGATMDDVIFNGCATRRPMPLAEATLIMQRDEDSVDGGEIAITRRLTRDGQSSYYLNGRPSRLKDIRETLLGTGIGNSAYSVIEQGRIGFILEASVKDRRGIIEEAAGISRYKARRKVASRKLEKVDTDLERIGQVLAEVDKRLRSVRRQAETALRYQELSARLRDLRMVFALEEFGRLDGQRQGLRGRLAELDEQGADVSARLGTLEAALSQADATLAGIDEAIRAHEQGRGEARSQRDVAANRLRDAGHRLVEIDQQEADDQQALAQLAERQQAVIAERDLTRVSLTKADSEADSELSRLYRSRREALDALLHEIDQSIGRIENWKGKDIACLQDLSSIEGRLGSLRSSRQGLLARQMRLDEKGASHRSGVESARRDEAAAEQAVAAAEAKATAAHARLDEVIREREEAQAEGSSLERRLQELRHEEGRLDVRLRLLGEYENKLEGVFRGVKDVLQEMHRLGGICGIVADCFQVSKEHELAIETALGGRAQNIITETQEDAKTAIDFLKRERRGRATFLPLDGMRGRPADLREIGRMPGVIGLASQLVSFDRRFQPVFDNLLGGTLICESLDHAIAVQRQHQPNLHLVTLEGDHIAPGGSMTGGRAKGSDAGGLVSRKNEIRRLEEGLKKLQDDRAAAGEAVEIAKRTAFDAAMAVNEQNRSIQHAERSVGEAKAQLMKTSRDRSHIEEFSANYGAEVEEIRLEIERIDLDASELEAKQQTLLAERQSIEAELAGLQTVLKARGEDRSRLQEEVSNLRVSLATTEERREAIKNHLGHLDRQLQELADQQQERSRRLEGHADRRRELQQTIQSSQQQHEEAAARFDTLAAELDRLVKQRDDLRSGQEEERQQARELQQRSRSLDRERSEAEVQATEIGVRIEGLSERILEDYDIDLAEAHGNYERPEDLDLPTLRRELAADERELSGLGPVNLAAIDELKEVEARQQFLSSNYEDLAGAKDKLATIIEDINTTSRRMFKKAFKEIRGNFQELFRKLYGGGKADLHLQLDEQNPDILEAGLEIIAQPPGKQPKSISLLSGGEKALTAIALLFAVYQTKPSPFCVLDEVDAPLDESNTDVYCNMLREFCDFSQFIVITHNKRTMQYADSIYGITQQERGVSSKISVKLEDVDASGELATTTRGQGPFAS